VHLNRVESVTTMTSPSDQFVPLAKLSEKVDDVVPVVNVTAPPPLMDAVRVLDKVADVPWVVLPGHEAAMPLAPAVAVFGPDFARLSVAPGPEGAA